MTLAVDDGDLLLAHSDQYSKRGSMHEPVVARLA